MSFQFVESGKTDPATRKLIRSHVMKGKNVGKTRLRPTRKDEGEVPEDHAAKFSLSACQFNDDVETEIPTIAPTIGHSFSALTFPCEAQPYMKNLIQQCKDSFIYPQLEISADSPSFNYCKSGRVSSGVLPSC
jgi:hypothetical protein